MHFAELIRPRERDRESADTVMFAAGEVPTRSTRLFPEGRIGRALFLGSLSSCPSPCPRRPTPPRSRGTGACGG
eukprot:6007045-Pyramimonas_sp.AAC.1